MPTRQLRIKKEEKAVASWQWAVGEDLAGARAI